MSFLNTLYTLWSHCWWLMRDGWMASLTRRTRVWVNSGSWWWTGRPGVLRFMGSQRVGHDWATELNWTELNETIQTVGAILALKSLKHYGWCSSPTKSYAVINGSIEIPFNQFPLTYTKSFMKIQSHEFNNEKETLLPRTTHGYFDFYCYFLSFSWHVHQFLNLITWPRVTNECLKKTGS